MAYYSIFPEKDTTLYSHPLRVKLNTGKDEILEIIKEKGNSDQRYYPSRILIRFKTDDITNIFDNVITTTNWTSSLELYSTEHKNLHTTLNVQAYAAAKSWDEGTGRFSNRPTSSNGASWIYRDNTEDKNQWITGSKSIGTSYASSSININALPSGSNMELTINGVDFVPVISSSLFDANNDENFVDISSSIDAFGTNLATAINASSSITLVTASYNTTTNNLILSGSSSGSLYNITIITSSVAGNTQQIFTSSVGNFSTQGGLSNTTTAFAIGTTGSLQASGITEGEGGW